MSKKKKPNNFQIELGLFFKQMRKGACMTQTQLCKRLGISQGALSKIEKGKLLPDIITWHKLCQEFKIFESYTNDFQKIVTSPKI